MSLDEISELWRDVLVVHSCSEASSYIACTLSILLTANLHMRGNHSSPRVYIVIYVAGSIFVDSRVEKADRCTKTRSAHINARGFIENGLRQTTLISYDQSAGNLT